MHRGEIYLVDFGDIIGSEQGGLRPALVVQNNIGNTYSPTTIICPLTTKPKNFIPTHVSIPQYECGIYQDSTVLCEQVRVIDKIRIKKKLGEIKSKELIKEINRKLMVSLGVYE